MKIVNIHAAKTQLSRLIADVVAGEEVVISKAGTPLVRLVPVAAGDGPRRLGVLGGAVTESADCWAPDASTESLFYGGAVEPVPLRLVAESTPARPATSQRTSPAKSLAKPVAKPPAKAPVKRKPR